MLSPLAQSERAPSLSASPSDGSQAAAKPKHAFSVRPEELAVSWDPAAGFAVVGACARKSGSAWLRAFDVQARRVGWDAEPIEGSQVFSRRDFAVRGESALLFHRGQLWSFDMATGRTRWRAPLPERPEWTASRAQGGGAQIFGEEGPIVALTEDRGLCAFDRETGRALWTRRFAQRAVVVSQVGGLTVDVSGMVEVIAPDGETRVKIGSAGGATVDRAAAFGRCVVLAVKNWGDKEQDGLLVLDTKDGEVLSFDPVRGAGPASLLAAGGGRVFVSLSGNRIASSSGRVASRGVTIVAMRAAGRALVTIERGDEDRLIAFDAENLEAVWDLGVLGRLPDDRHDDALQTSDRVIVALASTGDKRESQLRAFSAQTGEPLWVRPAKHWRAHYFMGDHLIALTRDRLDVLEIDTGKVHASYPA